MDECGYQFNEPALRGEYSSEGYFRAPVPDCPSDVALDVTDEDLLQAIRIHSRSNQQQLEKMVAQGNIFDKGKSIKSINELRVQQYL